MSQNQQQYLQRAVQVLKEHGMEVNVKNISHFVNGVIPENIIQEWIEAELEMQDLDQALDPDGLDKEGQAAWNALQAEKAIEPVEYCECGLPFGEGEHVCSTEEPEYDYEPDEYLFREDHPNLPRWPATGRDKDRYFGNAINPIQWNWW
jgi:hypothetical protein